MDIASIDELAAEQLAKGDLAAVPSQRHDVEAPGIVCPTPHGCTSLMRA
jgi:hypothetical protein